MKVLHISGGSQETGAGRGVLWLHEALKNTSIDSSVLFQFGEPTSSGSVQILNKGLTGRIRQSVISRTDELPVKKYQLNTNLFSTGWLGNNVSEHPLYKQADIIHLHWINRAMLSTRFISTIQKPVVWTLRDMWPMTGGCHYTLGCDAYREVCQYCPQLNSSKQKDLSYKVQAKKINLWNPSSIRLVAISNWLKECAERSSVFCEFKSPEMIPNCINTEQYFPIEQHSARKKLGINSTDKVVLCGAQNLASPYKGFDKFLESIPGIDRSALFVFFGRLDKSVLEPLDIRFLDLGMLRSDVDLCTAYSAADVFVAPSLQEAFGKTLIEAMACATPVVCFDATGPKDIVEHKITGYKASTGDATDLATGINWVLNQSTESLKQIRQQCLTRVQENFSAQTVATAHLTLYDEVLSSAHPAPNNSTPI